MAAESEIIVKAFGGLRAHIDSFPLRVKLPAGSRLQDLLAILAASHPQLHSEIIAGLSDGYINILVNGRNVRFLDGLDTALQNGASVVFVPPVGGG